MRWEGGRESDNVEDRRGTRAGGPMVVTGGFGLLLVIVLALVFGIDPQMLHIQLGGLLRDAAYWIEHQSSPPDEISVRLHHGLVAIHPFPNGNGRHARLMADLLIAQLGGEPFSWGGGTLRDIGTLRAAYISALKAADAYDFAPLLDFARS